MLATPDAPSALAASSPRRTRTALPAGRVSRLRSSGRTPAARRTRALSPGVVEEDGVGSSAQERSAQSSAGRGGPMSGSSSWVEKFQYFLSWERQRRRQGQKGNKKL
jgi:hypothetical protein